MTFLTLKTDHLKFNLSTKSLIFVLRLIVSAGILIYLVTFLDFAKVVTVLSTARLTFISVCPLILLVGLLFAALRWKIALAAFHLTLPLLQSFKYYLIGSFYSIILPGVIGGDFVRVSLFATHAKKSLLVVGITALVERITGMITILVIGAIAIHYLPAQFVDVIPPETRSIILNLTKAVIVLVPLGYAAFRLFYPKTKYAQQKRDGRIWEILDSFSRIPLGSLLAIVVLCAVFQFSDILVTYFLAQAILISLPLNVLLVILPVVYLAIILPISLGGLGVREGIMVFLLAGFQVPTSDAVMLSFLVYLNRLFVGLIGGLVQLLKSRNQ